MRLFNLTENGKTYTSNAYFIRGEWNTLDDVNTLIDTGRDPVLFDAIKAVPTGVGKTQIEQVLLTHNHYDHTGNLTEIIQRWHPEVYAFSKSLEGVTHVVEDDETIRIGECEAQVIVCPGHSSDSVCYYIPEEKVLFSGDTNLIKLTGNNYTPEFERCLSRLSSLDIHTIYPGHGPALRNQCNQLIRESLLKIRHSDDQNIHLVNDRSIHSQYLWFNIELANKRVGKIRASVTNKLIIIFSIMVFPEYERRGIARQTILRLKNSYSTIIADRVRFEAVAFWKKMGFSKYIDGGLVWKKQ